MFKFMNLEESKELYFKIIQKLHGVFSLNTNIRMGQFQFVAASTAVTNAAIKEIVVLEDSTIFTVLKEMSKAGTEVDCLVAGECNLTGIALPKGTLITPKRIGGFSSFTANKGVGIYKLNQ